MGPRGDPKTGWGDSDPGGRMLVFEVDAQTEASELVEEHV